MENKLRIGIVASTFNRTVTDRLVQSAKSALNETPGAKAVCVMRVPGAFEIPMAARWLAESAENLDAIICLGAILKGQTDQNKYLAASCFQALQQVQAATGIPLAVGIICASTLKQAMARTKGNLDRGKEAAEAAVAMARLKKSLQQTPAVLN